MSAQQWLEQMSRAMKALNYRGTVTFFKNDKLDSMNYFHAIKDSHEQESLVALNSPMREVIRDAGKVRCTFKKSKKGVINHRPASRSFIVDLPNDFSVLTDVVDFSVEGEEFIAMLPVQVISISAKDDFRYSRRIWIDKQHFLPLKVEVYDLSGKVLEQVVFTDLKVVDELAFIKIDKELKDHEVKHIHQLVFFSADNASFVLDSIPPRFQKEFFTRMKKNNSTQEMEHLVLNDGFSFISVYLEQKIKGVTEGAQTLGTVNSFTHFIDDTQITVIGEVPAKTVRFIAQGVKLR